MASAAATVSVASLSANTLSHALAYLVDPSTRDLRAAMLVNRAWNSTCKWNLPMASFYVGSGRPSYAGTASLNVLWATACKTAFTLTRCVAPVDKEDASRGVEEVPDSLVAWRRWDDLREHLGVASGAFSAEDFMRGEHWYTSHLRCLPPWPDPWLWRL
jgi:hypothetical protein